MSTFDPFAAEPYPPPPDIGGLSEGLVVLYHWTVNADAAEEILRTGLRDTPYYEPVGVHVCDRYNQHRGGRYDVLLLVVLPGEEVTPERINPIQLPDCHDYIIPSEVVIRHGTVRMAYPLAPRS